MSSSQFSSYNLIPNGTLVINSEFEIVFWNHALEKLSDIKSELAIGQNILNMFPRLSKSIYSQRIQNIFDGGPPTIFSALLHKHLIPCKLKDGSYRTQHTTIIPYNNSESNQTFALFFIQDVTEEARQLTQAKKMRDLALHEVSERKKVEKILRESEQELKILNANKDKLFSIIGHDLKNPFQAIMSFSDILIEDFSEMDSEEAFEYINIISEASGSAYKLLENLLNWARSQTGQLKYEPEEIDINRLTGDIVKLVEAQAQKKNISLQNNINAGEMAFADYNMLETIIRNLTTNAIKFTGEEGIIKFHSTKTADLLELTVEDSGIGMSDDNLKKLFRIDVPNTEIGSSQEKGTGLGLILCKEFIERNGGTIRVESEVNIGSKFIFTVPAKQ